MLSSTRAADSFTGPRAGYECTSGILPVCDGASIALFDGLRSPWGGWSCGVSDGRRRDERLRRCAPALPLTGCRCGEIVGLRWEDVHLDRNEIRLADPRTGPRTVSLSPAAARVFATLPWLHGNPWPIAGAKPGSRLPHTACYWTGCASAPGSTTCVRTTCGIGFALRALALGEPLPMIGKLLGHAKIRTTARYVHLARDTVRGSANRVAASIAEDICRRRSRGGGAVEVAMIEGLVSRREPGRALGLVNRDREVNFVGRLGCVLRRAPSVAAESDPARKLSRQLQDCHAVVAIRCDTPQPIHRRSRVRQRIAAIGGASAAVGPPIVRGPPRRSATIEPGCAPGAGSAPPPERPGTVLRGAVTVDKLQPIESSFENLCLARVAMMRLR